MQGHVIFKSQIQCLRWWGMVYNIIKKNKLNKNKKWKTQSLHFYP